MNNIDVRPTDPHNTGTGAFPKSLHGYFGSFENFKATPRSELEALQLKVLKKRFEALRDKIPMLKRLADAQKVEKIESIDEVVPLLFSHTIYKSYPISLLEKNRFTQLMQWLQKLCTTDFSGVDVSHCQGIDEWLLELDKQTPLWMHHSSGTSGAMSFIPRTKREWEENFLNMMAQYCGVLDMEPPTREKPFSMDVVRASYKTGGYSGTRINEFLEKYLAGGDESKMHILYPRHQSSDMIFLAARLAAAKSSGDLHNLELSPALLARKAGFEEEQKNAAGDLEKFMADMVKNLKGRRIMTSVLSGPLYNLSVKGLEQGASNLFDPSSILVTAGGGKGQVLPPDWKEKVKQFFGVKEIVHAYGMSEVMGMNVMCSEGRYHAGASAILFILDPDTGAPLPRKGVQTGRAAFFDLMADTYWGGFVSGDEITVDWDSQCPCGNKSAHIAPSIERYSAKRGGDDKITCAAASDAHDDALSYLTSL